MRIFKNVFLIFIIVFSSSCTPDKTNYFQNTSIHSNSESLTDTTPRITGIGGIFFASDHPDSLQKWYEEKMALQTDDYGAVFEFRNALHKDELNYLRWSVFKKGSDYLKPGKADFMINYRVNNLPAYIKLLQLKGVIFLDSMQTFDYGKFIHLMDADSNKIELWEPVDSILTKIGSVTNK